MPQDFDMMKAALLGKGPSMGGDEDGADMMGGEEDGSQEPQVDPRALSADGKTLFIDKSMFPKGCKIGDKVTIVATVMKHGDKYGVMPEEIEASREDGQDNEDDSEGDDQEPQGSRGY